MIVYKKSVDLVDLDMQSPTLMGILWVNRFTTTKGVYRNARGKCGKIPNKVCER